MHRKNWTQNLIIITALLLIAAVTIGISISTSLASSNQVNYLFDQDAAAAYHLMVLVEAPHQSYNNDFIKGIYDEAEKYNIAAEIIPINSNDYVEQLLELLDVAVYAKVDGVVLHGVNNLILSDKIEEVTNNGIPVIVLNEDLPDSKRISYVGVNKYTIGQTAGKSLAEFMNGDGKIGVIDQKSTTNNNSETNDLMLLGMVDVFKEYEGMNLELVQYTEAGFLGAEAVSSQMFKEHPEVNGLFCTNGSNALGVARILIDNNLVNDYTLVGFGDDEELLTYIEKGKIAQGTVVIDYEDIGRGAIITFYEYINKAYVSSYINTDLLVLDSDNVSDYIVTKEKLDEEKK